MKVDVPKRSYRSAMGGSARQCPGEARLPPAHQGLTLSGTEGMGTKRNGKGTCCQGRQQGRTQDLGGGVPGPFCCIPYWHLSPDPATL